MSLQLLVLLLPLEVEDQDFIAAALTHDRADDLCGRRAAEGAGIAGKRQHIAEFQSAVFVGNGLFNFDHVAGGDAILFTTGADDRVHNSSERPLSGRASIFSGWAETCSPGRSRSNSFRGVSRVCQGAKDRIAEPVKFTGETGKRSMGRPLAQVSLKA